MWTKKKELLLLFQRLATSRGDEFRGKYDILHVEDERKYKRITFCCKKINGGIS